MNCMRVNKLKLNPNKMVVLLVGLNSFLENGMSPVLDGVEGPSM